jgi:formate dehydrogenase beta subunit
MPSIIHELTLLQEREGWLSEPSLRALAERLRVPLHRIESVSTFYTHFRRSPPKPVEIAVCRDLSCMLAGGPQACAALKQRLAGRSDVAIREVSCIGRCDAAPAAFVGHTPVALSDQHSVDAAIAGSHHPPAPAAKRWAADVYASPAERYGALRTQLAQPSDLIAALKAANLRGMGGAGFPTGTKWDMVRAQTALPKYVVCNADESEPGTFKDREVLADLPHLVIEGIALGALTVGATRGWVFIRHEYEAERVALEAAIAEAYRAGVLGANIFGSSFSFELEIFVSPGGYILGEETALLECMEDKRGEPRNKPPFPGVQGLWGMPTLINNVETFAHVAGIAKNGVEWWKALGKPGFAGHKFISVSGDVVNPGVHLVAMGTTLRELLALCGGMKDGKKLMAIAPGGASSNFLPADKLDVPLDFKTLADAGSMLGSGAAVFIAEGHDLLQVGLNVTKFFRNESCGKCVPCRVGSEKAVQLLDGRASIPAGGSELLNELNATMYQTSICGLGQVALGPLISVLKNFPDEIARESK